MKTTCGSRLLLGLITLFLLNRGNAHELPPGFVAIQIADGLDPVCMSLAPDGRIFFTEKNGRVRIVENGQLLLDPFLEIEVDNFNERGLSGIAVDPDFSTTPYVYLYYTVPQAGHNRLSRFLADGNFAVPGSEEILLEFDELEGPNHNAGALAFASDGTLFIATGDGRNISAPQQLHSLLGKILRINRDGSIPANNPFYDQTTGKYRAIWSLGHRNPFAIHYDRSKDRLFSTDVGSHRFEEINEIFAGKNYGWPIVEGSFQEQVPPANYQAPIYYYDHNVGCAAVAVTTYQPEHPTFPIEYWDKIFFADYCNGKIMTFHPLTAEVKEFASGINRPLNLLTAPDGSMYYMARAGIGDGSDEDNTTTNIGSIWRIIYTGNNAPFVAVQPKDVLVSNGEQAIFEIAAFGQEPMQFNWQVNGTNVSAPNSPSFIVENTTLADSGSIIRCIILNVEGADTTNSAILHVTSNQRPVLTITEPMDGWKYRAGESFIFSGIANDPEDGPLEPSHFNWKIDFHHEHHTHPALGPLPGVHGDSFIVPQNDEVSHDVWFRINFSATDSKGLSNTTQRLVYPLKSETIIATNPPDLLLDVNGALVQSPFTLTSVVGIYHDLNVPNTAVSGDSVYVFKQWDIGETDTRIQFEAPASDFSLTAVYEAVQALSEGQGLTGTYFNDNQKNFTFQEPYIMRRIDPVIDFDWDEGSPNEEYLGNDYYLVRWEGFIKPLLTDTFDFHLITNDGSRLWIDNQPIIDAWFGQGTNEYSGKLFLEEEKFYPIKLEYFEALGHGIVRLLWSSAQVERSIVPSSQLFPAIPPPPYKGSDLLVTYFPNPVGEIMELQFSSPIETAVEASVFSASGQLVFSKRIFIPKDFSTSELSFKGLANGVYFVKLAGPEISKTIEVIHHR